MFVLQTVNMSEMISCVIRLPETREKGKRKQNGDVKTQLHVRCTRGKEAKHAF